MKSIKKLTSTILDIQNAMERWHLGRDDDKETLEEISEILIEAGFLSKAFKLTT